MINIQYWIKCIDKEEDYVETKIFDVQNKFIIF